MIYKFTENPGVIKDGILGIVKFSESIAIQSIESARTVITAGLESVEAISDKANVVILNSTRKALETRSVICKEAGESVKNIIEDTIKNAKEIFESLARPKSEDTNVRNNN